MTGAIQDWDRGVVVGRRSFGKGLVQRPIDLPDGSMIRLTIARYYTPAGRCIQKPYDSSINEKPGKGKSSESSIEKYNQDLIDRIDALGAAIDEAAAQHLCEIFENCCRFDLRFWDMVYAMGENGDNS